MYYEFRNILKKGICYRGILFDIFIKKNGKNINKLGVAISKKAGNSVKRNKIKRNLFTNLLLYYCQIFLNLLLPILKDIKI